jgi:type II secretion system protein N
MAEVKRGTPLMEKAGIAAYGILCLLLFTYLRFPYENFRGYLEQAISAETSRPFTLGAIRSQFPLGIHVEGVSIEGNKYVNDLILRPHFFSFMTGRFGMDVKALFPSGSLDCSFDKPLGKSRSPVSAEIEMENFDSSLVHTLFGTSIQPKGTISGTIELSGPQPSLKAMGGKASIVWKNGFIPLSGSQLPLDGLKFTSMAMSSRIERGMLTLDKMEMKGDMAGAMKGMIWMMDPPGRSRLNLTGEIMLDQALSSAMTAPGFQPQGMMRFSLRGTLDRPRFRILGSQ